MDDPVLEQGVQIRIQPLAVDIETAGRLAGVPSWTVRESILKGDLLAKKGGRQHIIQITELQRWIASLDDVEPSTAPSIVARSEARI